MEALSNHGHEIKVIDFEARPRNRAIVGSAFTRVFRNVSRTGSGGQVSVVRPGMVKVPGVGRMSSFVPQLKAIFREIVQWSDIVVLYSIPTNGLQTLFASRLLSRPFVFHSFDILHQLTGYSFLRAPTWTLERLIYPRASRVVVISLALRDYMKRIGVSEEVLKLIPPGVDTERFTPKTTGKNFRTELGIKPSEKVVLFSGWLYDFCGLDIVVSEWNTILQQEEDVKLVICGDGPKLNKLLADRNRLGLHSSVTITGRQPFHRMPEVIASADLCINPYLPSVASNFAFPSKMTEYMAAGKPVLATDLVGTVSLLPAHSGVTLVSPRKFVESLKMLLQDRGKLEEQGKTARKFCEEHFAIPQVALRFEEVLNELVGAPN
ncbi:MAG TPA: glycosyltransferase family 4 protein [Candidatus Bathyarchaeia archaeon]|nr:glycosyltransferase family 4 protein [Candidatus Bathyarchaeia archaeon]